MEQHKCLACSHVTLASNDLGTDVTDVKENKSIRKKVVKVVAKKFPTMRCAKIGDFTRHIYIPVLVKCWYHFAHKRMLSKLHCYNLRHKWYEESGTLLKMHSDYAEPNSQEQAKNCTGTHGTCLYVFAV
jgi:hypothetical protein